MALREKTKEAICYLLGMVAALICLHLHKGALIGVTEGPLRDWTLLILFFGAMNGLGTLFKLIMWLTTKYTA